MSQAIRHKHPRNRRLAVLGMAILVTLAGCGDGGSPGTDEIGSVLQSRSLSTLADREAFMGALRQGLVDQRSAYDGGFGSVEPVPGTVDGGVAEADSTAAAPVDGGSDDFSGTNVQEAGVDEQDRVKTDGQRLYVLDTHHEYSGGPATGIGADSLPAPDGGIRNTLRVLDMVRETPDAYPVADIDLDLGARADGFYLTGDANTPAAVVIASGFAGYGHWSEPYAFNSGAAVIARVPLSRPETAGVEQSLHMDGQLVSSRVVDNRLILANRFYPTVPDVQPWDVDEASWADAVAMAADEDLLPMWTDSDGNRHALFDPADCFVAQTPDTVAVPTADIITLSVIDLDTLQPIDTECFLGSTETVYASTKAVFLATTRWSWSRGPDQAIEVDDGFVDPRIDTEIHQFTISPSGLDYVASGSIKGHLGWNHERMPYRMSEHNGDLRVASMPSLFSAVTSPVVVTVLRNNGSGVLQSLAELPNEARPEFIGKPFENLYASRFVGDRAYMVTFRQSDPLYVIDLSRPQDPEVLGELEISGFSEWLLPIDDTHLLGLGREAVGVDAGLGEARGGIEQGVKLSLIDVSDPSAPREVSVQRIGERGSSSVALFNPRAITVQAATDTHPTRVALGIDVHGSAQGPAPDQISDPWDWKPWSYTGLHGYDVHVGVDARIEPRGALVAGAQGNTEDFNGPSFGNDRAVLAGDAAFYVHGSHVRAAHWESLANGSEAR